MRRPRPSRPDPRAPPRRTRPARGAKHRGPRPGEPRSPADDADEDRPDHVEEDYRQHWAEIEREPAPSQRRDHPPEEVEVRVRHLLDESDRGLQASVVGDPGNPGEQDPNED